MRTIQCDMGRIEDGMKRLNNSNNDIKYLNVWDTEHCVMRGISMDEMRERNILDTDPDQVCRIEYENYNSFRLHFHQTEVDHLQTFQFNPHNSSNCTTPDELGSRLEDVVVQLEDVFGDMTWDFAGVEAQSYGRDGKLTDFEFEYDLMVY